MQIPRRKSDELRALKFKNDGPLYLTPEGKKRLEERLERVKRSLPALIEEAARAAAYGDRSENFEYKDAKSNLRHAHRQVLTIEDQLKRAAIITSEKNKKGTVELGSTVVVETKAGVRKEFQILGSFETDPEKGRISNESPLGAGLMHHIAGDTVVIKTPSGPQEYRIIEVR